jgi:hypothetical protein
MESVPTFATDLTRGFINSSSLAVDWMFFRRGESNETLSVSGSLFLLFLSTFDN